MLDFLDFSFLDALDIVLVAILIYYIYKLLKGTVAINIFYRNCIYFSNMENNSDLKNGNVK